jgi:hypothetical protein
MTLDTQMTLALLQELLMALRANDVEGFKGWLALGLEELSRQVVIELMQDWMSPMLSLSILIDKINSAISAPSLWVVIP